MMTDVTILKTDGSTYIVQIDREELFARLYPILCTQDIQPMTHFDGKVMLGDGEGLLNGKEWNPEATRIAGARLVGHVAILSDKDWHALDETDDDDTEDA
jgi:hypothetical protein